MHSSRCCSMSFAVRCDFRSCAAAQLGFGATCLCAWVSACKMETRTGTQQDCPFKSTLCLAHRECLSNQCPHLVCFKGPRYFLNYKLEGDFVALLCLKLQNQGCFMFLQLPALIILMHFRAF